MVWQCNGDQVGGGQMDMIWAKQDESMVAGYGMNLVVIVILRAIALQRSGWICCGQNKARLWPLCMI